MAVSQIGTARLLPRAHHNSVAESVDGYSQAATSLLLRPVRQGLGETVARRIAGAAYARKTRFSDWIYYTVTRMR
jgi:hypothetical protein